MDVFSFTAGTGDRVYAATLAGFNGGSADTLRDIIAADATMVLEADDEDGAIESASNTGGAIVVIVDAEPERAGRNGVCLMGSECSAAPSSSIATEAAAGERCEID